ncbi:MAG: hypothetical protein JXC32_03020 [Anaerolineae bacterium]|nr:hypothetical protein [Anaerolineae bacterium]
MDQELDAAFVIGPVRLLTVREETFFHVVCPPTAMADLDRELDRKMPLLEAAKAAAGIAQLGPIVVRYYKTEEPDIYVMEVGVPVMPDTEAAGEARIMQLPPLRCASLLYWGSLEHIGDAYAALTSVVQEAGLAPVGEGREWYYCFEGDTSPNNVIGLQMAVR